MNEDNEVEALKQKIDQVELVPDEELKNMDIYELAYYMQTLNALDDIFEDNDGGEE